MGSSSCLARSGGPEGLTGDSGLTWADALLVCSASGGVVGSFRAVVFGSCSAGIFGSCSGGVFGSCSAGVFGFCSATVPLGLGAGLVLMGGRGTSGAGCARAFDEGADCVCGAFEGVILIFLGGC